MACSMVGSTSKYTSLLQLYLWVNVEPWPSACSCALRFREFVTPVYRTLLLWFVIKYMYPFFCMAFFFDGVWMPDQVGHDCWGDARSSRA